MVDDDEAAASKAPHAGAIPLDLAKAVESLSELYELLEDYAPLWYSEAIHDRALSTLTGLSAPLRTEPSQTAPNRKSHRLF